MARQSSLSLVLFPSQAEASAGPLSRAELQFWSTVTRTWGVEPGRFDVWVGGSSTATAHAEFTLTH